MAERIFVCDCGHKTRLSDEIITSAYTCPMCGTRQPITDKNTVSSEASLFEEDDSDDAAPALDDEGWYTVENDEDAWAPSFDDEEDVESHPADAWSDRWQPPPEKPDRRIYDEDDPREKPGRLEAFDPGAPTEESAANAFTAPDEPTAPPRPSGDNCARCGRTFRGDWDRNPTDMGELCHICLNLATEGQPVARPTSKAPPVQPMPHPQGMPVDDLGGGEFEPIKMERSPKGDVPKFAKNHPQAFRVAILIAGLLVIGLAFFFTYFHESEAPVRSEEERAALIEQRQEQLEGSFALQLLVFVVRVTAGTVGAMLAITLALAWDEKLPGDTWGQHMYYLLPLYGIALGASLLSALLPVIGLLITIAGFILILVILFSVFKIGLRGVVAYFVLRLLTVPLAEIASLAIIGLIGNLM